MAEVEGAAAQPEEAQVEALGRELRIAVAAACIAVPHTAVLVVVLEPVLVQAALPGREEEAAKGL